ncbi:hypothetical protein [Xylanibacter muris]|uniref:Uncharacterized protein n=1 Tax=Xylanibacter muris TaxID=2736290 RepID=A0ABX2AJQ9_9BACT|nr:hypothetical protein [Xylanibacter muris]NPD91295.1 hypothetical protein [Xylanibacter muris]
MAENIEVRSEKVRNVIGIVPRRLVRTGTAVITVLVVLMLVAVSTVHYPFSVETDGRITETRLVSGERFYNACLKTPYSHRTLFFGSRKVNLMFEGDDKTVVEGKVGAVTGMLTDKNGDNYCNVFVGIDEKDMERLGLKLNMRVHAVTYISDKTLLELISGRE